MKIYFYILIILTITSCHVTETVTLDENGAGTIEIEEVRDEASYMQIAGENYNREEKFVDTLYHFKDILTDSNPIFFKLTNSEQELYKKYENAEVIINKNSYTKDFRTRIFQKFDKIEEVPDLYKTEDYFDDLINNYALTSEEHFFDVSYSFDKSIFKRKVKITNVSNLEKKSIEIDNLKSQFKNFSINQVYNLNYNFANKILKVSNPNARISANGKSLFVQFLLSDCLQNPEITNLEVVLEKK